MRLKDGFRVGPSVAAKNHIREVMLELGLDVDSDGLKDTPDRVVRMLHEMTEGYLSEPGDILKKQFEADYDEMVVVKDVPVGSLCEHHLLPFHGVAHVGYLPQGKVVGLSKIPRLVRCLSQRLQIQERLTREIALAIEEGLAPGGVGVVIRAMHTCMHMRGIRSEGDMVTSCMLGSFRTEPETRGEFLAFLDR
ncbi:MAG: GTP cyclohydrolase I FolE [bacterium]|nr:GTP cyclohydrolase I FolE [bacterium]